MTWPPGPSVREAHRIPTPGHRQSRGRGNCLIVTYMTSRREFRLKRAMTSCARRIRNSVAHSAELCGLHGVAPRKRGRCPKPRRAAQAAAQGVLRYAPARRILTLQSAATEPAEGATAVTETTGNATPSTREPRCCHRDYKAPTLSLSYSSIPFPPALFKRSVCSVRL